MLSQRKGFRKEKQMIDVLIGFGFGLVVGGIVGVFIFALCAIQKRGDDK